MKKVLLFITIINCGIIQTQNVNIPDPIFKEKLLNHINPVINTNSDNEIQISEAEAITGRINVSTSTVSDITGIEAFVNMTEFLCAETNVTSVNMNSNTKLTYLDFIDAKVTNLNISNCTELKELWCFGNNLTSLNIENNKLLESVYCYDNQLTNLNIENNVKLKILNVSNNKLSSLNILNNTNLEGLACLDNEISNINTSNNLNLEFLLISENLLTTLDVSNNSSLYVLRCQDNPNLKTINLKNGNNQNFTFSGDAKSNFENLPNIETICIDDLNNVAFTNGISNQVGNSLTFTDNCSTLSNEEFSIENYVISPNPIENILTIKSKKEILKIEIYNYIGKLILEKKQESKINISSLKNGIYLLKIFGENGEVQIKKILKK
ncbi:T9SS type A sorting domain-containing protein [Polaribacter vadi]|uniref:T9SS type A sorting domain-containing protein n=1 Tax=Polaribacter TaxID=52959 RepID=UPI001C09B1D0|nr:MULTISPECIES: T9SS type A sorting domain-containing protein [Polaribacter]MBU3010285.1 T9SS type A sorting domain-containing protein [Polaribacter vadi]MDO6740092.1 T9SS type A sorting domain-containing protein [Polaribacter sp. 1_MG-2023]